MIKTVLKIDGMMCGMCESHMNDVVRKSCSPKKVNSSAKNGETVVISEAPLDIPYLKQQIKDIGYELVSYTSEPYEKKGFFHYSYPLFIKFCMYKKALSRPFMLTVCFLKNVETSITTIAVKKEQIIYIPIFSA